MKKYSSYVLAAILGGSVLVAPATSFAKCGGPNLICGRNEAKVCNPSNGKCCCAKAGTYNYSSKRSGFLAAAVS